MRKLYVVKKSKEFEDIINKGKNITNNYFSIYYKDNDLPYDRFGVTVGTKLGNSVFRNKYKRIIRSIVDEYRKDYNNSKDYIIIMRKRAISTTFLELKNSFFELMKVGENSEK